MNTTYTNYASDEEVALLSPSDVGPLFPDDQRIASGVDGSFDPSDRWTLHCSSVTFTDSGLHPGHVVRLLAPVDRFPHPGALFGVAEVGEHFVKLRRLGMAPGLGEPVAPPEGLADVSFVIMTLDPQISQASREVDGLLGIRTTTPSLPGLDGISLRDAVVRLVLARRYAAIMRDGDTAFAIRARLFEASFERLMTRLFISENLIHPDRIPRLGTRLTR
ncbi:hypothetical protein [Tautonia marina]|uniref:hypothetical protein n=1 Tax=Tautonia marina TaxID=2653855 RepID=UPI001260A53A|nr:hypothetical protein [Tautonia marina]